MHFIFLLQLNLNSTFRFTTDSIDFNDGSNNWLAGFWFDDNVPDITQSSRPRENEVSFTLHDMDNSIITELLSYPWRYSKIEIWRVKLSDTMQVISTTSIYVGELSKPYRHIENDSGKHIEFYSVDSAAIGKARGRRTNVVSQHQVDPTDYCFEQTPFISDKAAWGKEKTYTPTPNTRGGAPRKDRDPTKPLILT